MTKSPLSFARSLFTAYPRQTLAVIAAFTVAGLMEGIGVATMLPLLAMLSPHTGTEGRIGAAVREGFSIAHINPGIGAMLTLIFVFILAKSAISFFAMNMVGHITTTISQDLRLRLIRALLRAQWRHYGSLAVGRSANAIGTEAQRAGLGYLNFGKGLAGSIQVLMYVLCAMLISWQITVCAFAAGIGIIFALKRLITAAQKAGQRQTSLLASILARITDTLSGVKSIKAMGCDSSILNMLEQENRQLSEAQQREIAATQLLTIMREPLAAFVLATGLYIAIVFADMTIPALLVLAFIFFRVVSKLTAVQLDYQRMATMESAYWSIQRAIEDAESVEEPRPAGGKDVPGPAADIRLENISFSYPRPGNSASKPPVPILENINVVFPARSFSAVLGPSGTGKTTLLDLLIRFHSPTAGRICIGDVPLDEIDLLKWRRSIGYLPQETLLFHDTVLQNIAMGDPAMTREVATEALRQAGISEFVESLPEGIDTVVGERGSRISGGQRQRIAIARALARKPGLLLLDEPTSSLDSEAEQGLLKTLRQLAKNITVIAITHSEPVALYADKVFRIGNYVTDASLNPKLVCEATR